MKETVISWTVPNIVTVGLMLVLLSVGTGVVIKLFAKMRAARAE